MDGCKNVSISHTLPGGRYASVADSQCGQLGEFHTNLVNWTQLHCGEDKFLFYSSLL